MGGFVAHCSICQRIQPFIGERGTPTYTPKLHSFPGCRSPPSALKSRWPWTNEQLEKRAYEKRGRQVQNE
jgi:hypothetical protein